jgi:hypothetical protein
VAQTYVKPWNHLAQNVLPEQAIERQKRIKMGKHLPMAPQEYVQGGYLDIGKLQNLWMKPAVEMVPYLDCIWRGLL